MFERYTERARRALFFAHFEASQRGGLSIETEHLLLGVLRQGKGLLSRILARAHVSIEEVLKEIDARTIVKERVATSVEMPFSAETKHVLQFAAEEADRLLHNYIGTEHLLLGLLREQGSVSASILTDKGMHLDTVRGDIVELLSEHPELKHQVGRNSARATVVRRVISAGTMEERVVRYSRAVRIGNQVWVSGTTATAEDGRIVGIGDAYAQTKQALRNIEVALRDADATLQNIVRTRVYVVDIGEHAEAVGRAYGEVFEAIRPAASMIGVAGLLNPQMLVEIEADAVIL